MKKQSNLSYSSEYLITVQNEKLCFLRHVKKDNLMFDALKLQKIGLGEIEKL